MTACGLESVPVYRKPKVAVFSTGDELKAPGSVLRPGQIYDSNRASVAALLAQQPIELIDLGLIPDDAGAIEDALRHADAIADVVITSGGVSVGDADLVRDSVEKLGSIEFWRIDLKPGKPLAAGRLQHAVFFGLPGNPVSTIVCTLLIVKPALRAFCGGQPQEPLRLPVVAAEPLRHATGRTEFQRGYFVQDQQGHRLAVAGTGDQGSNRLQSFAAADCLIELPAERGDVEPGDHLWALPLRALLAG